MMQNPVMFVPANDAAELTVTVVADRLRREMNWSRSRAVSCVEMPRKCVAALLLVTLLMLAVPLLLLLWVAVPNWTLLIKYVGSPSTTLPVMTTVPVVPESRVAVMVVGFVSAR